MLHQQLNEALKSLTPPAELRGRVITAAAAAAERRCDEASAFDRRLNAIDSRRLALLNDGEYNPDYHKNMITRFTLCDPDDAEHLQGLVLAVSK